MNRKEMETKAIKALGGRIEKVLDVYAHGNHVDVVGTVGGDEVHYRVHFNGNEVESIGCK